MHRSQLGGLIIDCQTEDLESAAQFWCRALGYETKPSSNPQDEQYVSLRAPAEGPYIEVQRVSHPSRVHLDIETDDLEAEVTRLEGLGARRLEKIRDWWVLEAPTGHRFCVVPAETSSFEDQAHTWD